MMAGNIPQNNDSSKNQYVQQNVTGADAVQSVRNVISAVSGERGWAMSCYIPVFNVITCILTSIKMVNSKFCLFHARQGLILFALWFSTIVVALISPELSLMMWGAVLLLHGAGVFIAYQMKVTGIPVLGQLAMKIPENYIFNILTGKKLDKPVQTGSTQTNLSQSK